MENSIDINQAAEILKISVVTLRRWDESGKLPSIRTGKFKHRQYFKSDIIHFLNQSQKKQKLTHPINTFIFDFDSTIITAESFDEIIKISLSDHQNRETIMKEIELITNQGMEGKIDLKESLKLRLSMARVHKNHIISFTKNVENLLTPGIKEVFQFLQEKKQKIFIISGGFIDYVQVIGDFFNLPPQSLFANSFYFDRDGFVSGINTSNPLCTSQGKIEVIKGLKEGGMIAGRSFIIGDGISDFIPYKQNEVDDFLGFGLNVQRKKVRELASHFFTTAPEFQQFITHLFS